MKLIRSSGRSVRLAIVLSVAVLALVASVAMASAGPEVLPVEPDGGIGN